MRIEEILIGLIIFSMVMVGGAMIFNNINTNYELNVDASVFNSSENENKDSVYKVLDDIDRTTSSMKSKVVGNESKSGETSGFDILFNSVYSALKLIPQSFELMSVIMNNIAATIGIPLFVVSGMTIIFTLGLVFTVIYMIVRFKP